MKAIDAFLQQLVIACVENNCPMLPMKCPNPVWNLHMEVGEVVWDVLFRNPSRKGA